VQRQGLAGPVAAGLLAAGIQAGELGRVKKTQARIGRRDQKAVIKSHADVAGRGVYVAALEQAAADATDVVPGLGFSHAALLSVSNALVKKSSLPKLPDFRARCRPCGAALAEPVLIMA